MDMDVCIWLYVYAIKMMKLKIDKKVDNFLITIARIVSIDHYIKFYSSINFLLLYLNNYKEFSFEKQLLQMFYKIGVLKILSLVSSGRKLHFLCIVSSITHLHR